MKLQRTSILFLAAALAVFSSACGKKVVLTDIGDDLLVPGAGIEAAATLIDDPSAMKSLFKCYPPDSGVVPIYVTVRNIDTEPVQIHNLNYLPLGEIFRGFTLEIGGERLDPIHPLEAVMYIKGKADIPNYKEIRAKHVIGGIIIWPLGIYYIFRGTQYWREYKPLLRNSFFPAGRGGNFDPVTIEPGETASGFIYFALMPEDNPYSRDYGDLEADRRGKESPSLKVTGDHDLTININPAVKAPTYGDCEIPVDSSLAVRELRFVRREDDGSVGSLAAPSNEDFFALVPNAERGMKLDLVHGRAGDIFERRSMDGLTGVAGLTGKKSDLADVSAWGGRVVCAVNYKKKSRLFLMEWAESGPALVGEAQLDKHVLRLSAAEDAIYVTTSNGFCHTFEYVDLETRRYVNLGNSVEDVVMTGGKLLVFGKKDIEEYTVRPGHKPERSRKMAIPSSKKTDAGLKEGGVVVTHKGKGTFGDTLVLYDPESLKEIVRQPFPGSLDVIDMYGEGVLVQMTGGTVMRVAGDGRGYVTVEAGWIPVLATSSGKSGDIVTLVSDRNMLYSFRLESLIPIPLHWGGAVKVPARVGTPYGEPEEK